MIRKLSKKFNTQTAKLARTHGQNSQLLAINSSLSQTHIDIGLLLTERRQNEGEKEVVTEVRALLDKNDVAMNMVEIELDEGL